MQFPVDILYDNGTQETYEGAHDFADLSGQWARIRDLHLSRESDTTATATMTLDGQPLEAVFHPDAQEMWDGWYKPATDERDGFAGGECVGIVEDEEPNGLSTDEIEIALQGIMWRKFFPDAD